MSDTKPNLQYVFPHATGKALETVQQHQQQQELVLYAGWFCPFVQRCWVALEERGIPCKYVEINPFKKEPHFLAINPKGLVPAVEYQGQALYESIIICEFLEDAYPNHEPHLLPKDPYFRAHARIWIDYISKFIMPAYFRLFQAQTPETQAAALEEYMKALRVFSDQVRGPYFMGEEFGLVDIAIVSWIVRDYVLKEHRGFSREAVSAKFKAYADNLEKKESVTKTLSLKEHYDELFARHLSGQFVSEITKASKAGRPLP